MPQQVHRKLGIDWSNPEAVSAYKAEYQRYRRINDPEWAEKTRKYQRDRDKRLASEDPDFWKKQNGHIKAWKDRLKTENPEKYKEMVRKGQSPESKKRFEARVVKQDPAYFKRNRLKRCYGLTLEEYESKLREQSGVCAICRNPPVGLNKITNKPIALAVDHDHACCPGNKSCGKCVRGLLCVKCNNFLGACDDRTDTLEAAISYLKRYPTKC